MYINDDDTSLNISQKSERIVVIIFSEKYKKMISTLVLGAFALTVPAMALTDIEQAKPYRESTDKIRVIKQEPVSQGDWAYQRVTDEALLRADYPEPMIAVFDSDSGLYKIASEENLYLEKVSDMAFQPVEKSVIYNTGDLRTVSAQYHLTVTEAQDIVSFMGQCPGNAIYVYAPRADETLGQYDGKKCRLVRVVATDNQSGYELRNENRLVYAMNTLEKQANIGRMMAKALFNLLGLDFSWRSDSSTYATRNERVAFQYLDVYELDSAYITRGITSYGTVTVTTNTTCWVKQANGNFVNEPVIRKRSGSFGRSETLDSLAAKSSQYFEYYGDGGGSVCYTNYTTTFAIDKFGSIPAIQPKGWLYSYG